MSVHVHRMVLPHHLAELVGDALRQMRGDAASDADDLDVWDRAQPLEDVLESAVREHHRIATRQDDVADLGMRGEVLERGVVLVERDLLRITDLATTRAEA